MDEPEIVMPGQLVPRPSRALARYDLQDSPLWHHAHSLWGRIVTDPAEIAAIANRVRHYARPWWRRLPGSRRG